MTNTESKIATLSIDEIDLVDGANAGPIGDFFRKIANALTSSGNPVAQVVGAVVGVAAAIIDVIED